MGKTKTVVVTGEEQTLTGKEKYAIKQRKKKEALEREKGQIKGVGLKGGERIKTVGGEVIKSAEEELKEKEETAKKKSKVRGKKYKSVRAKVDKNKTYKIREAIKLVKETSYSKFDGSVELHAVINKQDLKVNVTLPHSTGKSKTIEVAGDSTLKKLKSGKIDFDVLLATPEQMPKLVPFAKLLGPKGLMPNPKNGTIIESKADAKKYSADKLTVKTERKAPVVHVVVGKVSQKASELEENIETVLTALNKKQIKKCVLSATMSPSIRIAVQ